MMAESTRLMAVGLVLNKTPGCYKIKELNLQILINPRSHKVSKTATSQILLTWTSFRRISRQSERRGSSVLRQIVNGQTPPRLPRGATDFLSGHTSSDLLARNQDTRIISRHEEHVFRSIGPVHIPHRGSQPSAGASGSSSIGAESETRTHPVDLGQCSGRGGAHLFFRLRERSFDGLFRGALQRFGDRQQR